jgi:hypothetical protein
LGQNGVGAEVFQMGFLTTTEGGELGHRLLRFFLKKIRPEEGRARVKWGEWIAIRRTRRA